MHWKRISKAFFVCVKHYLTLEFELECSSVRMQSESWHGHLLASVRLTSRLKWPSPCVNTLLPKYPWWQRRSVSLRPGVECCGLPRRFGVVPSPTHKHNPKSDCDSLSSLSLLFHSYMLSLPRPCLCGYMLFCDLYFHSASLDCLEENNVPLSSGWHGVSAQQHVFPVSHVCLCHRWRGECRCLSLASIIPQGLFF